MYPHERSLVAQLADKPFALIGVNSDGDFAGLDIEEIRDVVKEKNLNWRSFQNQLPSGEKISDAWKVQGWPTVYLIDKEGKLRYANPHVSEDGMRLDVDRMDRLIEELLAEAGAEVKISHDDHGDEKEGDESASEKDDA